jgi:hypothetical protein
MGNWLLRGDFGTAPDDLGGMILGLMLAFLCGHVVAWTYMSCHSGLSYSRSFVNSLIVLAIIVAVVMMVMANNLLVAFGLMAVFAIVRFRNILRDTLDTTYVLAAITIGMSCGTRKFTTGILATAVFAAVMLYLHWSHFGARHRYDLILNLHWARPLTDRPQGPAGPACPAASTGQPAQQCRTRRNRPQLPPVVAGLEPRRRPDLRAPIVSRRFPGQQPSRG